MDVVFLVSQNYRFSINILIVCDAKFFACWEGF